MKKYNSLKDDSFLTAFVVGGGPVILGLILILILHSLKFPLEYILSIKEIGSKDLKKILLPIIILNSFFLLVWLIFIFYKKGKKGSFLWGFVVSLILTSFFTIMFLDYIIE